jgi:hypothetical protein
MCSISREPRRDDQTTCTAVAPDFVFTVRTYGTGPLYGRPGRARAATRQPAGLPGNSRSRTLVTRAGTPPPGDATAPDLVWDAMLRLVERIAPDYKD